MTFDFEIDEGSFWTVRLEKVERLTSDEPEDDDTLFAVEFKAVGMSMNAEFDVLVSDIADESQIVVAALDVLQDGLETWARVLGRRRGAEPIEPEPT
jgi:hypothetical protein